MSQIKKQYQSIVYVDGFNLFYGACKPNNAKWLDIKKLVEIILPNNNIVGIRYFTARVRSTLEDPQKDINQNTYLRALKTLPNFEVVFGHFLEKRSIVRLDPPIVAKTGKTLKRAPAVKFDEKGSDVNLACSLLVDAFDKKFEAAIVISNDSDLAAPIQIVRSKFHRPVVVLNPHPNSASKKLESLASMTKTIRASILPSCMFPDVITDSAGKQIRKPANW